jgi:hypothetical protein
MKRRALIAAALLLTVAPVRAEFYNPDDAYHIARFRSGIIGGFGPSGTWAGPGPFQPYGPPPVFVPLVGGPPVIVAPPPVVVAPPPPPVYAPPPPPPPPPICVVNLPPREWLNLRVSPNGPILGAMRPGTLMALLNVAGSWGFVQVQNGPTGWAFLPYTICH